MKALRVLNLNCREAARLVSEGMDRRLSLLERIGLRLHLLICTACRQWRRQTTMIRRALRHVRREAEAERLSEPARKRIREAIDSTS